MKVYFTTGSKNYDKRKDSIEKIYEVVNSLGHSLDEFNREPFNPTIESEDSMVKAYNHIAKSIKSCDFVIAELSEPSLGSGFETALALSEKKPVLVLYHEDSQRMLSTPLTGNRSKYLVTKRYKNDKELESAIRYFVSDLKDLISTKFILIIPPEIDRYLEWNVREKGVSKAEITRQSIEEVMKNDNAYSSYLKENGIEE